MSDQGGDYNRGVVAGKTETRLDGHDEHFDKINGSLDRVFGGLESLTLAVQRLGDEANNRDTTVIITAEALKNAEAARRDKSDQSWSPWAKVLAVLVAAAAVAAVIIAVYHGHPPTPTGR